MFENCPPSKMILALLNEELGPRSAEAVIKHLDRECPHCLNICQREAYRISNTEPHPFRIWYGEEFGENPFVIG